MSDDDLLKAWDDECAQISDNDMTGFFEGQKSVLCVMKIIFLNYKK